MDEENPGLRINDYDIAQLVAEAHKKTCSLELAEKGFECTGICPLNPHIFSDLDFMAAQVTEIPDAEFPPGRDNESSTADDVDAFSAASHPFQQTQTFTASSSSTRSEGGSEILQDSTNSSEEVNTRSTALSSGNVADTENTDTTKNLSSTPSTSGIIPKPKTSTSHTPIVNNDISDFISALSQVSPVPACSERRLTSRRRKAQRSEVLTSSPYKNALLQKQEQDNQKKEVSNAKKTGLPKLKMSKRKQEDPLRS